MADRLINVYLSEADAADRLDGLRGELGDLPLRGIYEESLEGGQRLLHVITPTGLSEQVLDICQRRLDGRATPRIVVLPVEVSLPADSAGPATAGTVRSGRISRQELYQDVRNGLGTLPSFLALVVLSTIVAAVGLVRDNTAVVIGAMVLAPLLGPNIALALATTLGDLRLAGEALRTGVIGLLAALAMSIAAGALMTVDPTVGELAARTDVALSDMTLALASGCGAALSLTGGLSATLLGVMVAVALLPPTVAAGVFLGASHPGAALGALLLLATNLVCVNLAMVVTFWSQGIRPRTMWQSDQAALYTRRATMLWAVLVVLVIGLILLARAR